MSRATGFALQTLSSTCPCPGLRIAGLHGFQVFLLACLVRWSWEPGSLAGRVIIQLPSWVKCGGVTPTFNFSGQASQSRGTGSYLLPQVRLWIKSSTPGIGFAFGVIGFTNPLLSLSITRLCSLQVFSPALLVRWAQQSSFVVG